MLNVTVCTQDGRVLRNPADAELKRMAERGQCNVWFDLHDPTEDELSRILDDFTDVHALTLQDVRQPVRAPKVDNYGEYVVVSFHSLRAQAESQAESFFLDTTGHTAIVGRQFLVTVSASDGSPEASAPMAGEGHPREQWIQALQEGPALLLYRVLSRHADASRTGIEALESALESLGDVIFTEKLSQASQHQIVDDILTAKHTALRLHRILEPQAEVMAQLGRERFPVIPPDARIFFQDMQNRWLYQAALANTLRELATSTMTTHLTLANHRLNEVMKVLTVIATIFIPLTFVTGIYGMNFRHMPELQQPWAYPATIGLCLLAALAMFLVFKRKRWF